MNAVERLRRDHKILRSKLDVLESALKMGPETWFVLREVCFTLSRQIRDHIRREEELVAACRKALDEQALRHVTVEHQDEPRLLRTVNCLFVEEQGHSLERVKPALSEVIGRLRAHMAEEEVELFPTLERYLREREAAPAAPEPSAPRLDETMTVNWVIQECPCTQPVFRRLFVNVPFEGTSCLDEVAWRHGMESRELLELLEAAMAGNGPHDTLHVHGGKPL